MDNIAALVAEAREQPLPSFIPRSEIIRELAEPARFNLVEIITGMRRSGKTFYLYQKMSQLLEAGVPRDRLFYFDFADDRLSPLAPDTMASVIEEFWRQVPEARTEGCYLFLDEVQEMERWQGVCQRLAEHEKVTLVITGSSSKLSSEEIATKFRGRSHSHEMLPLSFREFCLFQAVEGDRLKGPAFSPQTQTFLEGLFDRYLTEGELLQSYVRDVVARDVAERLGREDIRIANQFALYGLRNTACEFSVNQLVESFKELGFKIYWEKADRIMDLLRQAFLLMKVEEHAFALKPQTTATPKVYGIDPGIVYAVSRANQQDVGKRFETAAYLELRRRMAGKRTESITSYTAPGPRGQKVDFLLGDALAAEPYALIQVTASMASPRTREREVDSLVAAMEATGIKEGTIVTLREEERIETEAGPIEVVPACKWFLR